MNRIVIIGGSAAGPKAAAKARRMDQNAEITIIQKDENLSMATCGYPYFIGGMFDDKHKLICTPTGKIRDPHFFKKVKNINALINTEATKIDRENRKVYVRNLINDTKNEIEYDKLIICTGSSPINIPIPGRDLEGITFLKEMEDAEYLKNIAQSKNIKNATIIGGGLIGIETAEALQLAGFNITLVEMQNQILPFLDFELAKIVEKYLKSKGINVITSNAAKEFIGENNKIKALKLQNGDVIDCELAVVAIGVKPNTRLAKDAGIEIGQFGGIKVNKFMQTSDENVYSAGDCVEITNLLTNKNCLWPMGDAANLQGRCIGQNVVLGNVSEYSGTIMTGICKIFDYNVGSTGMSEAFAKKEGINHTVSVIHAAPDKPGFMGAMPIIIKLVANKYSGKLLGAQIIGLGDVSKRLAIAAMAIQNNMTIHDLINLDLPYAPPFSPAIDNFLTAIHVLENKIYGRMESISSIEVNEKINNKEDIFLMDVRGPEEFEAMRLGKGETLIPLGKLRNSLDKLPEKNREIIVYCKISLRGYEAYSLLTSLGWTNVKVMEGGLLAWPFDREK